MQTNIATKAMIHERPITQDILMGNETIIVGAGAAGLISAKELSTKGHKVIVLEARDRIGGRIHTINDPAFPIPLELGAEFVHGDLPVTKELIEEAGLNHYQMEGGLLRSEAGKFIEQEDFIEDIDRVIKKLKTLPTDSSVADFLNLHFSEAKHTKLRKTLISYVEGYDAADAKQASSFALLQELLSEDDHQYRVKGGYGKLMDYLFDECTEAGCFFEFKCIVQKIKWKKGVVSVTDQTGKIFNSNKVVVTVPLGVLQREAGSNGQITFSPSISEMQTSIRKLGYGNVIKTILQFKSPIWKNAKADKQDEKKPEPAFIFSDAEVPTWWTQLPEKNGMLTGWLAGPNSLPYIKKNEDELLDLSLKSLEKIFNMDYFFLQSELTGCHIANWGMDDFARGAYSYERVDSKNAKSTLSRGVENTIFFAGEAYHEGRGSGTVEAALESGQKIAKKILGEHTNK
ncbi:MAG: flavin monoamine oxidase family protein [Flavitalea sp.]